MANENCRTITRYTQKRVDGPLYFKVREERKTTMRNRPMAHALATGKCLDVRKVGEPVDGRSDLFKLNGFIDGVDYCDAENEMWIWSIGKDKQTGDIFAATDARFYSANDLEAEYECLWLR
jgi:hypothetical protein